MALTALDISISVRLTNNQNGLEIEESKMKQSLRQFADSLSSIRKRGLWEIRGNPYESFDDYCRKKLGISQARASQIITAAGALNALEDAADGDRPTMKLLENMQEGALREVKKLRPRDAIKVIRKVAKSGPITPKRIREHLGTEKPQTPEITTCPHCGKNVNEPPPKRKTSGIPD